MAEQMRIDPGRTWDDVGPEKAPRPQPPKVLFINQYYWPDRASTAQHLADLAEWLAARGMDCRVLCGCGTYHPGEPRPRNRETREGVAIERVAATSFGRRSTLGRMTDYLTFYLGAALRALTGPKPDLVVTLTTPPLIGLIGFLMRRLRGVRHVCWSMDLHPDASLALGRMKPRGIASRLFQRLARLIDKHADGIVVLGPYMGDRVRERGVRESRIVQIPVWSRRDEVDPWPWQANPFRESLGLSDKTVFMYSGNMGLAHAFDDLLQAIEKLQHRADLVFLFVGDGPRKREIEARLAESPMPNVRMLDSMPRSDLGALLTLADVHLITMRPEMTGIVVPSKLYGIMAAARPALFVGPEHCETADTIREADCGLTIRPGDVTALVASIEELAASHGPREAMGLRGREHFLREYEREVCCCLWNEFLESLVFLPRATVPRPTPHAAPARAPRIGPPRLRRWNAQNSIGAES